MASTPWEKFSTENTCDPMCMCIPTSSIDDDDAARSIASAAAPECHPNPNFESSWPVLTNSWVCASTPGVTRIRTRGARSPFATSSSMRSISSKLSTTIRPTPTNIARRSSSSLLLLPWSTTRFAGMPAARAMCISPPVATSSHIPSSWAMRAIAVQRKALVAYGNAHTEAPTPPRGSGPQLRFVVDEQRCAVLAGEIGDPALTDGQFAVVTHTSSVGQQARRDRRHIRSGAPIPSSPSPVSNTRAVRSHRARRLSRTSSAAFSTGQAS